MIMEKEGFEFRGYKLGQEIVHKFSKDGKEIKSKIIGFDTEETDGDEFMVVLTDIEDGKIIKNSVFIKNFLEGYHNSCYVWVEKRDITILKTEAVIPNHKHKTLIYLSQNMVWRKKDIIGVELGEGSTVSILSKVTKTFVEVDYESNEIRDNWFKKIIEQING